MATVDTASTEKVNHDLSLSVHVALFFLEPAGYVSPSL